MNPFKQLLNINFTGKFLLFLLIIAKAGIAQSTFNARDNNGNRVVKGNSNNIKFIENKGQVKDMAGNLRPDILYVGDGGGAKVYLRQGGLSYVMSKIEGMEEGYERKQAHSGIEELKEKFKHATIKIHRLDVEFVGALSTARLKTEKPTQDYFNYYTGKNPEGITGVKAYNRVVYEEVYKNIDIAYYGAKQEGLEYDFIVKPGGNIKDISLKYKGAEMKLVNGKLKIQTVAGELVEWIPKIYQDIGGKIINITGGYQLKEDEVQFKIGKYNKNIPLIIDPCWITYIGGSEREMGDGIAVDANENVIISGLALSLDFPVTAGAFQTKNLQGWGVFFSDVFISKFDPAGNLMWSTFYGGTDDDGGTGIAVDGNDDILLTGYTLSVLDPGDPTSVAFPVTTGAFQTLNKGGATGFNGGDAFVLKLTPAGIVVWCTLFGGIGPDDGWAIATDNANANEIVITGSTGSDDLPIVGAAFQSSRNGAGEAFVAKFDALGTPLWSTYYGGSGEENWECGDVAIDRSNGNIVIAGYTGSNDLPMIGSSFQSVAPPSVNAFIVQFNPSGVPLWSTYLGGGGDWASSVAIDGLSNVLVAGFAGATFPATAGAQQLSNAGGNDGFIAKLNAAGSLLWASYWGGSAAEETYGIVTNANNEIYICGDTYSTDYPVTSCVYQTMPGMGPHHEDNYLAKFDPDGSLICSSYIGLTGHDEMFYYGNNIATSGIYVYMTGFNQFGNYPVTPGAFQTAFGGGDFDVFVNKLCGNNCGLFSLDVDFSTDQVCTGKAINYTDLTPICDLSTTTWSWFFQGGNPATSTDRNPSNIVYSTQGNYDVKLVITTPCGNDSLTKTIDVITTPLATISGNTTICSGERVTLTAATGNTYLWNNGTTTSVLTTTLSGTTSYTVIITNGGICNDTASVNIIVNALPAVTLAGNTSICKGDGASITASGGGSYQWNTGTTTASITTNPTTTTTYTLTVTNTSQCFKDTTITITVNLMPLANAGPDDTICLGENAALNASGGNSFTWSNGATTAGIIISPPATNTYTVNVSNGNCYDTDTAKVVVNTNPTANAGSDVTITTGTNITLSGSGGGSYLWSPATGLSCITCKQPVANPPQTTTYCMQLTDANGCTSSDCVTVTVESDCQELFVPTAFSPNSDISNELLCIYGTDCIKSLTFSIYDRWGEKVFETNDPQECWDGIYRNRTLTDAVVYFFLEAKLINKEKISKKGTITLIR